MHAGARKTWLHSKVHLKILLTPPNSILIFFKNLFIQRLKNIEFNWHINWLQKGHVRNLNVQESVEKGWCFPVTLVWTQGRSMFCPIVNNIRHKHLVFQVSSFHTVGVTLLTNKKTEKGQLLKSNEVKIVYALHYSKRYTYT